MADTPRDSDPRVPGRADQTAGADQATRVVHATGVARAGGAARANRAARAARADRVARATRVAGVARAGGAARADRTDRATRVAGVACAARAVIQPVRDYRRLAWIWVRAVAQYPTSLILMSLAVAVSVLAQVGAILIVFGHAGTLAGFTVYEGLMVFGLAASAFGIADMFMGAVERLGQHIRSGSLDAMLIRPVSPLVQVAADEFSPRRLGKVVPALAVLGIALANIDVEWTPGRALLIPLMMLSGVLICCAIWVATGCLQFFVADAREAANSLTYGGQALTEYPLAIYGREIVRSVTYVVPLAFISWQPALLVLDRPDPLGMPEPLRYAGPVIAVLACTGAALLWRFGLRHYRSTGS